MWIVITIIVILVIIGYFTQGNEDAKKTGQSNEKYNADTQKPTNHPITQEKSEIVAESEHQQEQTPHEETEEMFIKELWEKYQENNVAVNMKYSNKRIQVYGLVLDIKQSNNEVYVAIEAVSIEDGIPINIRCYLKDINQAIELKTGEVAVINGIYVAEGFAKKFDITDAIVVEHWGNKKR